jgi:hypothetical protein
MKQKGFSVERGIQGGRKGKKNGSKRKCIDEEKKRKERKGIFQPELVE